MGRLIEKSRWIWHREQVGRNNVYLHFRRPFTLHSGRIERARGKIPTTYGSIKISLKKGKKGIECKVVAPERVTVLVQEQP